MMSSIGDKQSIGQPMSNDAKFGTKFNVYGADGYYGVGSYYSLSDGFYGDFLALLEKEALTVEDILKKCLFL